MVWPQLVGYILLMTSGRQGWSIPSWAFVLGTAAYVTLAFNVAFLTRISAFVAHTGARGWFIVAAFAALVFAVHAGALFSVAHPKVLRVVAIGFVLVGAPIAYAVQEYGISLDHRLVATAFETNRAEARDLITLKLIGWFTVVGLLPAWLLWRLPLSFRETLASRVVQNTIGIVASAVAFFVVLFSIYGDATSLFREQRQLVGMVTPANSVAATVTYGLRSTGAPGRTPMQPIAKGTRTSATTTADAAAKPSITVLVVGETARGDHFSLNGYGRPTNPRLAAVPDLISFADATSCATLTAESLPCMFSGMGRAGNDKNISLTRENMLDMLKGAGFDVVWIDNQAGCKGVCARIETVYTAERTDPRFCATGECHDEILVDELGKRIGSLKRDTVIVLHMMGSHGPAYWKRYPAQFEVFTPACRSAEFSKCSRDQIVAAYDNTIRYTDHVLGEMIDMLDAADKRGQPASLLYMSDHGESLGEKGIYLHGLPFYVAPRAQTHVPFVMWLSNGFQKRFGVSATCLLSRSKTPVSHDNYFHTVLGLLSVTSAARVDKLNLAHTCVAPERPAPD